MVVIQQARAALYVRVSSSIQADNYSLSRQEAECRQYATEHGYTVADSQVYREVHTGAELYERPALTRLREAMKRGEVDALICYDLDRFSRKQVHIALLQDFCERAGVELLFSNFDFTKDATGQFLLNARVFAAELEREKIIDRTQGGMKARIASGKLGGRTRPLYGYTFRDASKGAYDINEAEAAIVRQMFHAVTEGLSMHKVADQLNAAGVPTPTGQGEWHAGSIRNLLRRDEYTGVARARVDQNTKKDGKRVRRRRPADEQVILPEGTIPPIVSREVFEQVQRRLERNKAEAVRNHRHPEDFLPRAGYIFCGYCGRAMRTRAECHNQRGVRYRRRYVTTDSHDRTCPSLSIDQEEIDAAVWRKIVMVRYNTDAVLAHIEQLRTDDPTKRDLAGVDRLLAEVAKKQTNIAKAIAMLDDDDAKLPLIAELRTLGQRKAELEHERAGIIERRASWELDQERIDWLKEWCAGLRLEVDAGEWSDDRFAVHIATRYYQEAMIASAADQPYAAKRCLLDQLGVKVKVYRASETPRYHIELALGLQDIAEHPS
jgi:site-specific DNA recombinase